MCGYKAYIIPWEGEFGDSPTLYHVSMKMIALNSNPYLTITSPRLLSLDQTMVPQKAPLAVNKKSNI